MKRNKRALLVVLAAVFVVVIFSIKSSSSFNNAPKDTGLSGGLTYNTTVLKDLVNKDSDSDGILDWEEGLWGTDPKNKDTDGDGTPDSTEIASLKMSLDENNGGSESASVDDENLTETDKFSRELVATMAALSQTGEMDQASIDQLGSNLATQIANSTNQKIYKMSEIKITSDDSAQSVKNYGAAMEALEKKYPIKGNAVDILDQSLDENGDIDSGMLSQLDPIITQMKNIVTGMTKIEVPKKLAPLHLAFINATEKMAENLSSIQMVDIDALLSLGAMSQYEETAEALGTAATNLQGAMGI